jgi:hypothetical protein
VNADAGADTVRKVGSEATFRARPAAKAPTAARNTAPRDTAARDKSADSGELQLEDLPPAAEQAPAAAQDSDEFQLMPLDEDKKDEDKKNEDTKVDEDFDPTAWLNEPDDAGKSPPAKSPPGKSSPKKSGDSEDDLDDFLKSLE